MRLCIEEEDAEDFVQETQAEAAHPAATSTPGDRSSHAHM